MAVAATVRFRPRPDQAQAFETVFGELARHVRREDGAELCRLGRSRSDPGVYVALEIYRDDDAIATHSNAPHTLTFGPQLMALLAEDPVVEVCDLIPAKAGEETG